MHLVTVVSKFPFCKGKGHKSSLLNLTNYRLSFSLVSERYIWGNFYQETEETVKKDYLEFSTAKYHKQIHNNGWHKYRKHENCKKIADSGWTAEKGKPASLTNTLNFSSSFSRFCWICRWIAEFSSESLVLLTRTSDCTRASVCIYFKVVAAWRFTDCPPINDFSLARPLRALNALLA